MSLTKVKAGNILLTTPSASSNDVTPATTQYVTTALANLADSAPSTLNTLNELAAALGDDANFSTTVTNSIALKAPLASPAFNSGTANVVASFTSTDGTGAIQLADNAGNVELAAVGNDFHIQNAGSAAKMVVLNSGKVGIGDTSPFAKLHVEDTGWSSGAPYGTVAYIQGGATNDANWGHLLLSQSGTTTDTGGRLAFGANGENPIAGIRAKYKGATYGDLAFSTRPSGGTNTERMCIAADGTTTIGRAITPTYDNDQGYPLHIQAAGGNQTYLSISVPGAASGDTGLVLGHDATGTRITNREADPMIFGISSSEKMRIHSDGNVGIGNTSPSRALLHVGGNGIALNTSSDVSKTAILRTSGTGNYSTSGNGSAAHALTLMRGSNAADGDQVGLSFVLDNGGWSATSEIMAEVEQASSANTRLNFKTWNASGSMRTTSYITSEGQVVKPYQSAFVAVRDQAQSIAVNQNVIFNNAYKNIGADYNTSNGSYTAPISGFYFFSYTILIVTTTTFHIDHYLKTSNHSFIGGMPGRIEYQAAGSGTWGDGYIGLGHAQTVYMDAGDTAHVDFSELGGATRTVYGNSGNNWTKFTGYFLG